MHPMGECFVIPQTGSVAEGFSFGQPASRPGKGRLFRRQGIATLVVMLLISVAMAMSYAVMRSQTTSLRIHRNATQRTELQQAARTAAYKGLNEALEEMRSARWADDSQGIETVLSRPLGDALRYVATYDVGDPELNAGDDDYHLYPYRVTVVCTGYAADPETPTRESSHRVRAVLQLVPKKLGDAAPGWDDVLKHAICQYRSGSFDLDVPVRLAGDLRVRGEMELCLGLDWDGSERWWYLKGLKDLARGGGHDYRPISGTVRWYGSAQRGETHGLITTALDASVEVVSSSQEFYAPWTGHLAQYRLYPGGEQYRAVVLGSQLQRETLAPDPVQNPLGIFVRYGAVHLDDDVTVQGTLVTVGDYSADVEVYGTGVRFEPLPYAIPRPAGVEAPIRLPAMLSTDDARIHSGSDVSWEGAVYCGDDFRVHSSPQDGTLVALVGHLAVKDFYVGTRDEFEHSDQWWNERFNEFWDQHDAEDGISNWAVYVQKLHGLKMAPRCRIEPDPDDAPVHHHWPGGHEPLFVPGDDDEGALQWELLRCTDSPEDGARPIDRIGIDGVQIEAAGVGAL